MGLNIGSVPEALERVQALFRLFPYPEQAPSSVVPTDAVRTEHRSDPYSCNRRRQVRLRRGQAIKLSGQIRLYRPRSATVRNGHEHPPLLRASMTKLEEYIFPSWITQELLDPVRQDTTG